jgi:hypothetical protein
VASVDIAGAQFARFTFITDFAEVAAIIKETEFSGFNVVVITEFTNVIVCVVDNRRQGSGWKGQERM